MRAWSCFKRPQETLVLGHFDTNPNCTSKFPITFPGATRVDSRCKFEIRNCGGTRLQFRNCSGQGVNRPPFKMAEKRYFPGEQRVQGCQTGAVLRMPTAPCSTPPSLA